MQKYILISVLLAVVVLSSYFAISTYQNRTLERIDQSVDNAIDFLYENQLDYGEFRTFGCRDEVMQVCDFDSSPYVTAYVMYSIKDIEDERVRIMAGRATGFLLSEQKPGGLWSYYTSRNDNTLKPDVDDTSVVSFVLKSNGIEFEDNIELILNNKDGEGLFYTWMDVEDENDIDCVVNANVLLYLGQNDPTVCSYINKAIENEEDCLRYSSKRLALFYVVSRAFENGITCLGESKDKIIIDTLNLQKPDGSFGNEIDTAIALNVLLNFGYHGEGVSQGIANLLERQSPDGSWGMYYFYWDFAPTYYGSKELTTALAVEAMGKYRQSVL